MLSATCVTNRLRHQPKDAGAPQFLALSAFGLLMVILPSPRSWLTSKVPSTLDVLKFWHVAFEITDVKRMLESDLDSDIISKKRFGVIAERADPIAISLYPHSCKLGGRCRSTPAEQVPQRCRGPYKRCRCACMHLPGSETMDMIYSCHPQTHHVDQFTLNTPTCVAMVLVN